MRGFWQKTTAEVMNAKRFLSGKRNPFYLQNYLSKFFHNGGDATSMWKTKFFYLFKYFGHVLSWKNLINLKGTFNLKMFQTKIV